VFVGSLIGLVNACLIVFANVNSFIATLGMSSVLSAATVWLTGNQEIVGGISSTFQRFGSDIIWGVPVVAYYMVGLAIVVWFVMEYTPIGRRCYAVGGNADAARLSGVPVARYIVGSLLVSATIAAAAGVVFAAQIGSASLNAGPPFLLPAFASVFLGATQIHPGRVNVPGTIVAVALLAIGIKGLQLVGAPNYISDLFNGLALILAVGLASLRRGEERYAINA
jgi:ribose transport system permease protein